MKAKIKNHKWYQRDKTKGHLERGGVHPMLFIAIVLISIIVFYFKHTRP